MIFRYDRGRLGRNLTGALPLAAFPAVLHLTGRADPVLYGLFGTLLLVFLAGVLYTALRFEIAVTDEGLKIRGRVRRRTIRWSEIEAVRVRRGHAKPHRFMGPAPYSELVVRSRGGRRSVISSLPLGEEGFANLLEAISEHRGEAAG